jgi:hypothetical protein
MKSPTKSSKKNSKKSSGYSVPGCPVLQDTQQIQGLAHDLAKTLRKLRRDLNACRKCPNYDNCQVLKDFNNLVQTALEEVASEWDYSKVPEE